MIKTATNPIDTNLSTSEASIFYGYSKSTLRKNAAAGMYSNARKIGGQWRFRVSISADTLDSIKKTVAANRRI